MLINNKYTFKWSDLGEVPLGRPNLGNTTSVAVYRLMQYTMRSVLNKLILRELTVGRKEILFADLPLN